MHLRRAGILVRKVLDDHALMERIESGSASAGDRQRLEADGHWLNGGFYLGSTELYQWLREMPAAEARGLGMTRISHINELYGGSEQLERLQRREARFFNTCMMMTALGAAVSDGLEDGRVVSGVGGQYNFVAMAHALRDGRSVLLFRATREQDGRVRSSVVWNYGHCTIPRHLRDIAVTEYGIADLRGVDDAGCVEAMIGIADARFFLDLHRAATEARKARPAYVNWESSRNTPASLRARLAPFRASGLLPDYPLGCDFTPVEQRLARALGWLKSATAARGRKLRTLARALAPLAPMDDGVREAVARMDLSVPRGIGQRVEARLLRLALAATRAG
jgi:acyl-CoA hydrolase